MPGPAIHHIIAEEVAKRLKEHLDPSYHSFLDKLSNEFAGAFYLGSQGPDFLFFNTKDIDPILKKFIDYYLDIIDFVEDFKEALYNLIPQQLKDAVDLLEKQIDNAVEHSSTLTEIGQLCGDVQNTIKLLEKTLVMKLEQFITDNVEIFELLESPVQEAHDVKKWWWFDTLHNRRTGQYAEELLKRAALGTQEHAYALGYLTHYASDITGHPFVNILSGGPYRTHPNRHKLVENHHDVMAYRDYYGGEFIQSKLGEKYVINGDEKQLPHKINSLIRESIEAVYFKDGVPLYGTEMKEDDVNDAYRLWLYWFRKTTNSLDLPKPTPYSLTEELEEVWDKFTENLGDTWDAISGGMSGDAGILGVLKALATAILAPFLIAAAAIDAVLGAITTLGVAPIRFLISLAYDELYTAYMNLHQAVVLNGFAFPFNSQLDHYIIKHVYDAKSKDSYGHNAASLQHMFPTRKFKLAGMECESHLIYPFPLSNSLEPDKVTGAPISYYASHFSRYMFGPLKFNVEYYSWLKEFIEKDSSDTPSSTNRKFTTLAKITNNEIFGSAIDFSCNLYTDFLESIRMADFSLDADRGIGFKAWRRVEDYEKINDAAAQAVKISEDETVRNTETDIIDPSNEIL